MVLVIVPLETRAASLLRVVQNLLERRDDGREEVSVQGTSSGEQNERQVPCKTFENCSTVMLPRENNPRVHRRLKDKKKRVLHSQGNMDAKNIFASQIVPPRLSLRVQKSSNCSPRALGGGK